MRDEPRSSQKVPAASGRGQVFFRYRGADGREYITDSAQAVPSDHSGSVEVVALEPPAKGLLEGIDSFSLLLGMTAGALMSPFFGMLVRRGGWILKLFLLVALVGLGTAAYLGVLRRSTGLGTGPLASPGALIEDARRAVEQLNTRVRERDQELKKLEQDAK